MHSTIHFIPLVFFQRTFNFVWDSHGMSDPHYPITDRPQLSAGDITVTTYNRCIMRPSALHSPVCYCLLQQVSGSETSCRLRFSVHLTDASERWEFRSSYMRRVHLTLTSVFSLSFPLAHGHLPSATVEFDGLIANISTTKYGT